MDPEHSLTKINMLVYLQKYVCIRLTSLNYGQMLYPEHIPLIRVIMTQDFFNIVGVGSKRVTAIIADSKGPLTSS